MNKQPKWTTIRKRLSKVLNISPDILDFLSNYDIMVGSASGVSNKEISEELEIDESTIEKVLLDNIGIYCGGWKGFTESSCINPYYVFRSLIKTLEKVPTETDFADELQRLTGEASFLGEEFNRVYQIVSIFSTIRYKYLAKYRKEDYGNYIRRNSKKITRL